MKRDQKRTGAKRDAKWRNLAAATLATAVLAAGVAQAGTGALSAPKAGDLGTCGVVDADRGAADQFDAPRNPWEEVGNITEAHTEQEILARTRIYDHRGGGAADTLSQQLAADADKIAKRLARQLSVQTAKLSKRGRLPAPGDVARLTAALDKVERAARAAAYDQLTDWTRRLTQQTAVIDPALARVLSVHAASQLATLSADIAAAIRGGLENEFSLPKRPQDALSAK